MTSPTTIKRLRELLEKAPAGPWERDGDGLIAPADATAVGSPWVAVAVHHACLPLLEEVSRHLPALLDRVEAMERTTEDFKLPCDVKLENGTKFHKGVPLSTLILGLQRRAAFEAGAKVSSHGGEG